MLWLLLACARAPTYGPHLLAPVEGRGLSGLAMAEGEPAELWALPERSPELIRLSISDGALLGRLRLVGLPEGLDTESLALLPDGRVLLGTESQQPERGADRVLVGERRGEEVHIVGEWSLSYAPFGVLAEKNRGVEGLCAANDGVVALGEQVLGEGERRAAAAWIGHPDRAEVVSLRLGLTTPTGKLSAADCRREGEGIRLWAIERHYEVMRLSTWLLLASPGEAVLPPERSWDLSGLVPGQPNLEGLVVTEDGRVLLINDNDYGGEKGPSVLWRLPLDSLGEAR